MQPKRSEYALNADRLETYTKWPINSRLKPEDLAAAGFYYAGYGDCTRCFFCGGGLRNWEDEDDIWVEHARWFPTCTYVCQHMGAAFVEKVQELNKTHAVITYPLVIESMGMQVQLSSKTPLPTTESTITAEVTTPSPSTESTTTTPARPRLLPIIQRWKRPTRRVTTARSLPGLLPRRLSYNRRSSRRATTKKVTTSQ
jgi:hypothetical protein